jgi:1-acyl-sn-glycerol-3-phosphate acyltransferase
LWLFPASSGDCQADRVQRIIHYAFRFFLGLISALGGMRFVFYNHGALDQTKGCLLVANHPTLLDVVLLISRLPQADCIIKKELMFNPFLKAVVRWAGYIPNDGGTSVVQEAIDKVRRGRKVIIFPEGTRSTRRGLNSFTAGFAHIAVRAHCLIVPLFIHCFPSALTKEDGWFTVPRQRPVLGITVGTVVDPAVLYKTSDPVPVAVRKTTAAVEKYFQEKVDYETRNSFGI